MADPFDADLQHDDFDADLAPDKPRSPADAAMLKAQTDETLPPAADLTPPTEPDAIKGGGALGSVARGLYQGLTSGEGDELYGTIGAADNLRDSAMEAVGTKEPDAPVRSMEGEVQLKPSALDAYRKSRDDARAAQKADKAAHPWLSGGAELVGSMLQPFPFAKGAGFSGAVKQGAKAGAVLGTANAAGDSEADLTNGEFGKFAGDTAKGLALGTGLGALSAPLAWGAGKIADKFTGVADKAQARATDMANAAADKAVASKRGAFGQAAQALVRKRENAMRDLADPNVPEATKQGISQWLGSSEGKAAAQASASNNLNESYGALGKQEATKQEYLDALMEHTPEKRASAADEILDKPQMKSGMWEIAKRVGPAIGGYALDKTLGGGGEVGGGLGLIAGAISGHPGRILRNRFATPAFQNALGTRGAQAMEKAPQLAIEAGASEPSQSALSDYLKYLNDESEP